MTDRTEPTVPQYPPVAPITPPAPPVAEAAVYVPPAPQGYAPPVQQGYAPPAQQGYAPPAQQAFTPVDGWGRPVDTSPRPRRLGLAAMIIAVSVFVLSFAASAVVGINAGPLASRTQTSFNFDTNQLTAAQASAFAPIGILMGVQILVGTVLGILALVLGIVAVATKRGRPFGVVAIVVAGAAPIVSLAVYMGTLMATLPSA